MYVFAVISVKKCFVKYILVKYSALLIVVKGPLCLID